MSTMREIAAEAGVSLKTVSRVFNNDPHVSPDIRERVQQLLRARDYIPNELSQTFRTGRDKVIGIAVPSLLDPFYAAVVEAVSAEAQQSGYGALVTASGFDPVDEQRAVASLLGRRVAGLILASVSSDQSYLAGAVPTVLVDQPAAGVELDSFVHADRFGATLATRHLLEHGFRRIGFIGRAPELSTMIERLAGYRDALEEAGVAFDSELVAAEIASSADASREYADLRQRGMEALFTADPRSTIACIPSLKRDPVALIGFGDFALAKLLDPAVSVIEQSPEEMGREASHHLFSLIGSGRRTGSGVRQLTSLPVILIERQSCLAISEAHQASRPLPILMPDHG